MADEPPIGPGQEQGGAEGPMVGGSFADQSRAMRTRHLGNSMGIGALLMTLLHLLMNPDEEEHLNDAKEIPADPQEVPFHEPSLRRLAIRSTEVPPADPGLDPRYRNPRRSLRVSG